MSQIIDAIYEDGVLKPLEPLTLQEHIRVRIQISPILARSEGIEEEYLRQQAEEILALARASCEGLSEEELAIMESMKLDEIHFFSNRGESK
ncbi:DUF104 domain-containing protein [Candidatus Poribacteria bacterium]|nr:DUF104 domain-containing protein [Candidatus Poribacteria bacterium]